MTAKVITYAIQKGGCGKSTSTCVTAYLMATEGYKVLVVDIDSQGNTSELLTDTPCNEFIGKSVLEAMYDRDPHGKIVEVTENIHVLPANNLLATFPKWIYTGKTWDGEITDTPDGYTSVLKETLDKVLDEYDYILIDTPPSLSEHTTNAFFASDWVVIMFECSRWCYSAIPNFMETLEGSIAYGNINLKTAGILRTLSDGRRIDMKLFSEQIEEDYPELVFDTVIKRSAPIGRLSLNGFEENSELKSALGPHRAFYKELMERVGEVSKVGRT